MNAGHYALDLSVHFSLTDLFASDRLTILTCIRLWNDRLPTLASIRLWNERAGDWLSGTGPWWFE